MKVLILTDGTRGDVQLFVALAAALDAAGHEAVLALPASSASLAEPHSLRIVPFDDMAKKLITERLAPVTVDRGAVQRTRLAVRLAREYPSLVAHKLEDIARAAEEGADIVVHWAPEPGHHLAERLGVRAVPVCNHPSWVPTNSFPDPNFPFRLPQMLNRASYTLTKALPTNVMLQRVARRTIDKWRQETLGLPPRRGHHNFLRQPDNAPATVLQAYSQHVLPSPLDYPNWIHTTGFWFLPTPLEWTPVQGLSDFLAAGDPPIYVGFGSMVGAEPQRTTRIVAEAIRLVGVRAVIATGWGGIDPDDLGKDVFCLDQAPHDWLFPRMAAIVHHGGAGTTGTALAAGRPQVICPFIVDQPFNAQRMHTIGVAATPQPQRQLTAGSLAHAIRRAITDQTVALRAEELGHQIRAENGVTTAVRILESLI